MFNRIKILLISFGTYKEYPKRHVNVAKILLDHRGKNLTGIILMNL